MASAVGPAASGIDWLTGNVSIGGGLRQRQGASSRLRVRFADSRLTAALYWTNRCAFELPAHEEQFCIVLHESRGQGSGTLMGERSADD